MSETFPPFTYDWDGDIHFYDSMEAVMADLEPDDLRKSGNINRIVYDSRGQRFMLSLNKPSEIKYTHVFTSVYEPRLYQLDLPPDLNGLREILDRYCSQVFRERDTSTDDLMSIFALIRETGRLTTTPEHAERSSTKFWEAAALFTAFALTVLAGLYFSLKYIPRH